MLLYCMIGTVLLAASSQGFSMNSFFPRAARCGAKYGHFLLEDTWACDRDEFITPYPRLAIQGLLNTSMYADEKSYMDVTKNCQGYTHLEGRGRNKYYSYQSICRERRNPVTVVWATVPGYTPTHEQMQINNGQLPCHVLEGQTLYRLECVHPMSIRQKRKYSGVKRHFCRMPYGYSRHYLCRPDQYVTREVLVFSEHARRIFALKIPHVPSACTCGTCYCKE